MKQLIFNTYDYAIPEEVASTAGFVGTTSVVVLVIVLKSRIQEALNLATKKNEGSTQFFWEGPKKVF